MDDRLDVALGKMGCGWESLLCLLDIGSGWEGLMTTRHDFMKETDDTRQEASMRASRLRTYLEMINFQRT